MPRDHRFLTESQRARFIQLPNHRLTLSLFVFLIAVYSLTYSGTFVADDEHILASRTISLAFDGNLNDARVYGNGRVFSYASSSPEYAAQGLNIEPGQAIVGSLFVRLAHLVGTGHVQTMFLLNIWITAVTAIVLFHATLSLGFSRKTAFILGLSFGVGTVAWPYTRTYFRDALAMMFLTIAWACAFFVTTDIGRKLESRRLFAGIWILLIASLFAGILTKNTVIPAIPVLMFYISSKVYTYHPHLIKNNWKSFLLLFLIVVLVLAIWLKFLPSTGILSRFTFSYYWTLVNNFFTTPHPHFWQALAGPFISPGKSIFLYSPVLMFSVIGLFKRWDLAWPSWAYALVLMVGQALFYDEEWWGHINWGLRYLLPAIPLLMIASAPMIERLLRTRNGQIGLFCIGTFSVVIQLLGVLPPMRDYYVELYGSESIISKAMAIWNLKYSAMIWHMKYILSGGSLELAAVRVGAEAIPVVIGFLFVIGIILLGWKRPAWSFPPFLACFLSIGLSIFMLKTYADDPVYYRSRKDLEAAQLQIARNVLPDDIIVIKSYGAPVWYYWMNWADRNLEWTSLPYYFPAPSLIDEYHATDNSEVVLDEITLALLQKIPSSYRRVWFVLPYDSPGAELDIEIDWIALRSVSNEMWGFPGDTGETRVFLAGFD